MIEYADLSEKQKDELMKAGMNFMRMITEIWGSDDGMKLWDKIGEGINPDLKGAIFFAMLTGKANFDVTLSKINSSYVIDIIKALRDATGCGLKEAKDVYDNVRDRGPVTFNVPQDNRSTLISVLRGLGCEVR